MKKITVWVVLCLLLLLMACSRQTEIKDLEPVATQESSDDTSLFKEKIPSTANRDSLPFASGSNGISLGLYNPNGNIETEFHFQVEEGESVKKFISLGNMIKKDRLYKLILLVDYQQVPFSVDDGEPLLEFDVQMKAGQTIEIPVEVPPLSKGLHDILFVIAKYPDDKSLDEEFRKKTDLNHLLFQRFSVSVGDNDTPNKIQFDNTGELEDKNLGGVFLSKNNDYQRWLTENVGLNERLQYFVHIGNSVREKDQTYALVILSDWKQINITQDKNVLFYKLQEDNAFSLKTEVTAPDQEGVYDLTALLISNPFQKLDMYNRDTEASIRVGVNVK
ncbi:hypothetical protein AB4Z30_12570 [Paenibacillus sp. 2TAF8]|uniref:hypothetical protein n=1 Tax=Paenibacillus sp. 2TAF8 TaxID=3233020 RepID=UPI003F9C41E6